MANDSRATTRNHRVFRGAASHPRDTPYLWAPCRKTGSAEKAILINAVSVGGSFAILALSRFRVMAQFGALIGLSMGISALISLTVIPVLLMTVKQKFIYGNKARMP
jgi:predicted RND superfamily exporter protein